MHKKGACSCSPFKCHGLLSSARSPLLSAALLDCPRFGSPAFRFAGPKHLFHLRLNGRNFVSEFLLRHAANGCLNARVHAAGTVSHHHALDPSRVLQGAVHVALDELDHPVVHGRSARLPVWINVSWTTSGLLWHLLGPTLRGLLYSAFRNSWLHPWSPDAWRHSTGTWLLWTTWRRHHGARRGCTPRHHAWSLYGSVPRALPRDLPR